MQHNIAQRFLASAAAVPQHPAIEEAGQTASYARLHAIASGFVGALRAAGVRRGDRVAVLLERGISAAAGIVACHLMGAVAVVLNERLRARQLQHILADCSPAAVLSHAEMLERAGLSADGLLVVDSGAVGEAVGVEAVEVSAEDPVHIIYTSGSTGLPKGVVHTHGSIGRGVEEVHRYLGMTGADRVAALLAFSSVYGLNQLLCTLRVGGTLVAERAVFPADVVAAIRTQRLTIVAGVPPLWTQLLGVPEFSTPIPTLRQMQNAGGHLPVELVRRLRAAQPQADLFLQYGMTETWRGTFLSPAEVDARPGSMGQAMPSAELFVVREDGSLCGPDEVGELVHAGPTIAQGYWGARGQSQDVFAAHPTDPSGRAVHSGDFVRRDAEGFFYYVGRRDRIIKTQGHRVGPDEVADVLIASGQVREAVVTGEPDPERGQRIVAWVVLAPGGSVAQLKRYCRGELPPHMQPARYVERDDLPRLASGKFDVAALTE